MASSKVWSGNLVRNITNKWVGEVLGIKSQQYFKGVMKVHLAGNNPIK